MSRNIKTRLSAALLAVVMLLSAAACSGNNGEPEKVKLTNVFKSEAIPVPESVENVERAAVTGDKIFFYGSGYDQASETYMSSLYVMNIDGTGIEKLFDMSNESDPESQIHRSRYLQAMAVDASGNLWFSENEYYEDYSDPDNPIWEQNCYIKKIDTSGNTLFEINAKELKPENDYFYVNSMVFDGEGNLYISMDQYLYILDKDSGKLGAKLESEDYISSVVSTGSGEIYISGWGREGGLMLKKVDTATKSWGEQVDINNSNLYNLMPGSGEYDFYYQDSTAVYGYKIATQESIEVLNWINSDINSNRMNTVVPLSDGRMVAMQWKEQPDDSSLLLMTPRDPADIPETIILTYAAMWLDSSVRSAIIKFNRSQEEYRIQVKDYSQYSTNDNWMAGYEKLNMDIVSGEVPDIISLDGLNIETYINKGLLADIYPMIDNDPELKREDFMENVLEAASRGGKLYQVIPTFSIFTVAAKTSLVGPEPGWTMEDLMRLMNTMPEGTVAFSEMTRSNILSYSTMMAMDQFIDSETGKCSFDGDGFIQLLEFANQFEEEIDWEALYGENYDWEAQQNAYKEDRVLLMPCYVYTVRDIRNYREQYAEDITFIGFPTANKNGTCIVPNMQTAISAKSKHQDAAWQFLRGFLTEDYFNNNENYYYALPINKNVLKAKLDMEKVPLKDRPEDSNGNGVMVTRADSVYSSSSWNYSGEEDDWSKNYHLTDAEADQIWTLITSVNSMIYNDQEITTILNEEVEYFFKGNKSARDVAQVIQNKIQTYISESR